MNHFEISDANLPAAFIEQTAGPRLLAHIDMV
jgi:hypothetical protein